MKGVSLPEDIRADIVHFQGQISQLCFTEGELSGGWDPCRA